MEKALPGILRQGVTESLLSAGTAGKYGGEVWRGGNREAPLLVRKGRLAPWRLYLSRSRLR